MARLRKACRKTSVWGRKKFALPSSETWWTLCSVRWHWLPRAWGGIIQTLDMWCLSSWLDSIIILSVVIPGPALWPKDLQLTTGSDESECVLLQSGLWFVLGFCSLLTSSSDGVCPAVKWQNEFYSWCVQGWPQAAAHLKGFKRKSTSDCHKQLPTMIFALTCLSRFQLPSRLL